VMTRRYYRIRPLENVRVTERSGRPLLTAEYSHDGTGYLVIATVAEGVETAAGTDLPQLIEELPAGRTVLVDLYVTSQTPAEEASDPDARADRIRGKLGFIPPSVSRVSVAVRRADGEDGGWPDWFTFRGRPDGQAVEDRTQRGWHPLVAERLGVWRFSRFELTRLAAAPDVHLFRIRGREMPDDQRLMALADVRDLTIVRDDAGRIAGLPQLERILDACLDSLRAARSADRELARLDWNRIKLYVWPTAQAPLAELGQVIRSLAARTGALGLELVMVQFRDAEGRERMLRLSRPPGAGLTLDITEPPTEPLRELNAYTQKVIRARRRGTVYPYELIPLITRSPDQAGAPGTFTEYDLDSGGAPAPVNREPGLNTANIVLGVVSTPSTMLAVFSPRRAGAIPRASAGWSCSATRRRRWARWPSPSAAAYSPPSTWPGRCTPRWSGTPSRPGRRSRWTPAPRPWTGSPGRCAGSSSSPRTAARSTWW